MLTIYLICYIKMNSIRDTKKKFFKFLYNNKIGHIPSALSAFEILYVLYNKIANITAQNFENISRDRVIISKEHCRAAQCFILKECNLLSEETLNTYFKDGGFLGHDMYNIVGDKSISAVDYASGSLGHGLSVACGYAWDRKNKIYVIVGDGELQEGTCWEAIMFAGHNKLSNLTVIVDKNFQQISDYTTKTIDTSTNIGRQFEEFGFFVTECNGHDIEDLEHHFKLDSQGKPKCIVANTVKGKEILFTMDYKGFDVFHWDTISKEELEKALQEV